MDDRTIKSVLADAGRIAVVGASPNPARPSYRVMKFLLKQGYDVVPVRPKVARILDRPCYERLEEIPLPVDIVNVFRRPEACADIARAAVAIEASVLWLQEGIISQEAASIAQSGGLQVIMDACIMKEHKRLFPCAS